MQLGQHLVFGAAAMGVFLQGAALVVVVSLVSLRRFREKKRQAQAAAIALFRDALCEEFAGTQGASPAMAYTEAHAREWLRTFLSLGQDGQAVLRALPLSNQLRGMAKAWLAAGMVKHPPPSKLRAQLLLAVALAGALLDKSALPSLIWLSRSPDTVLAHAAVHATARIHPELALQLLIHPLICRPDWEEPYVVEVLKILAILPDFCLQSELVLRNAPPAGAARFLRALARANELVGSRLAHSLLIRPARLDDQVLGAALDALTHPEDHVLVAQYAVNRRDHLRVRAAKGLGRLGQLGQEAGLLPLLSDADWWVRQRAAQALASLPGMSRERLLTLAAEHPDGFSRDSLHQVANLHD